MKKIEYSPESKQDLLAVKKHITLEFGEETAIKVIKKITGDIRKLEIYENIGVAVSEMFGISCDYKYLLIAKNYAFCRMEGEYVKIIRVLNGQQDFIRILFDIEYSIEDTGEYWEDMEV